jgi:UTP--glucose-1-phosphate uridylyltransferase
MLPIFSKGKNGLILKPLLQALFEQLYDFGLDNFCFIVGRGKRAIEDHFTPDYEFLEYLKRLRRFEYSDEIKSFYEKIEKSTIT